MTKQSLLKSLFQRILNPAEISDNAESGCLKNRDNSGPDFESYPYGSKYSHLAHATIHKQLYSLKSADDGRTILSFFDSPNDAWIFNKAWLFENCKGFQPLLISILFGVDPSEAETLVLSNNNGNRGLCLLFGALLPFYKESGIRNYLVSAYKRFGPTESIQLFPADKQFIIKLADPELVDFIGQNLPSLALTVKDFNDMGNWVRHTDYSHWYTYEYESLLSKAVDADDVPFASFLLDHGASPNQRLQVWIMRQSEDVMETSPIIEKIRSAKMFELFCAHGVDFYPWCGYVHEGQRKEGSGTRHNLLELLWKNVAPSTTIQELLETLYKHNYDEPSRLRMRQLAVEYVTSKKSWKCGIEFEKWVRRNGGPIL